MSPRVLIDGDGGFGCQSSGGLLEGVEAVKSVNMVHTAAFGEDEEEEEYHNAAAVEVAHMRTEEGVASRDQIHQCRQHRHHERDSDHSFIRSLLGT